MSAYEMLDEIRDITNCPDGKSITQHVAALRRQVEELKGILAAVDDHWHGGGSKTKELHATVQAARVGASNVLHRANRAEAELARVREVSALLVGEEIQRAQKAEAERDSLRAVHDAELGVCHQHCDEVKALEAKFQRIMAWMKSVGGCDTCEYGYRRIRGKQACNDERYYSCDNNSNWMPPKELEI